METAFLELLEIARPILSFVLMALGGFFVLVGAVGIYRFPDFYTRLHAAGVTDTLGAELILLGLVLQAGFTLLTVKLLFIILFVFFTSPTSTHAIANAALRAGLKPYLANPSDGTGAGDDNRKDAN